MNQRHGWAFPDADTFMANELQPDGTYQYANLVAALKHVIDFRVAVDAGAHVGTWSKVMAGRFERVLAFEPSPDTFDCLVSNLATYGCTNVMPYAVALGASHGSVSMMLNAEHRAQGNTGARYVREGGDIPRRTLDSYALPALGFLKMDIEGSEYAALQGATETIRRCRPVILFENKWLWSRYFAFPKEAVAHFLHKVGYRKLERVSCDEIWGPAS